MKRLRALPRSIRFFAVLATCAFSAAFGGPENTIVVVNADSWASTCVANEYIHARGIPPWNVIYLTDLPNFESISVADFREKILSPILQTLDARQLAAQTDAILYSSDFPTMINLSGDIGQEKISPALTPYGSINGLTFLYQAVLAKTPAAMDLATNYYMRRAALPPQDADWTEAERGRYQSATTQIQETGRGLRANRVKPDTGTAAELRDKLKEITETLLSIHEKHPEAAELNYNIACAYALAGKAEDAVRSLNRAVDSGWWEVRNAALDEDLAGLRGRPDFEKFLARTRELKFEPQPAAAFRGALSWLPSGQAAGPEAGRRYLLSTMLACTSGRGNSVREAVEGLRRSVAADCRMPKGTIYFEKNSDVRSTTREWGFDSAAAKLKELGVNAVVETGILPENKQDVAGLLVGASDFHWAPSKSRILPGAICEHLTSCGGMLNEGDGQTPLTEFLRYGAAGASGAVSEPFALQAKFPTPFIQSFYAQGSTLSEAFYQSISGPYQLLIVGDALCKPWGRRLVVKTGDVSVGDKLKGLVKISATATSPDHISAAIFELYVDGKRALLVKSGTPLDWDTRGVPDGFHEISIVASASDAVASQGRLVIPVEVRNSDEVITVSAPGGSQRPWDKPIVITADQPGAKEIVFMQNVRPVARILGGSGTVTIDPHILGQGPVRLMTVALRDGAGPHQIIAKTTDMTIVPPAPLPAITLPPGKKLVDEIDIRIATRASVGSPRATGDWLSKAGIGIGDDFTIEGWFEVPEEDVYQFQLNGNTRVKTLSVDGVAQVWPRGKEWWFVPVNLSKGLHRLEISAAGVSQPTLDIRFGGPGALRLDGTRFKRLAR